MILANPDDATESIAGAANAIRSIETARVHLAPRRRGGGVAPRGAGAAAGEEFAGRLPGPASRVGLVPKSSVSQGPQRSRPFGRPDIVVRVPLGGREIVGSRNLRRNWCVSGRRHRDLGTPGILRPRGDRGIPIVFASSGDPELPVSLPAISGRAGTSPAYVFRPELAGNGSNCSRRPSRNLVVSP